MKQNKQIRILFLTIFVSSVLCKDSCYWNADCRYNLFSPITPYDTVRGDIRDYVDPPNCKPISVWSLHRHGTRNPKDKITAAIKVVAGLKDEIIASHSVGRGQLCAQDIEEFRNWKWNDTLDVSASYLTGVGYEELYDMGKRLREKYPNLLNGTDGEYYFRPTNEQRTIASANAFVHGLTDGTNLNLSVDSARKRDTVIRAYRSCDKYNKEIIKDPIIDKNYDDYFKSDEFIAVQNAVQKRLGISTVLTATDVYDMYELCRFSRVWGPTLKSPWCAAFSNQDLVILEYKDDIRHYYVHGYGSPTNVRLGGLTMRDLYEKFQEASQGKGKKIVSYFTHDTILEMVYCALGMYKDESPITGSKRDIKRKWRASYISPKAANLIAILYSCEESGSKTYRFQMLHNERVSAICPSEGCTWQLFQDKFQQFINATMDFCSSDITS